MPMKPHKGESQSDFMSRCVPEMVGTGADKRPQEQAVAICMDIWRQAHGGKKPKKENEVSRQEQVAQIIARMKNKFNKDAVDDLTSEDCPPPEEGEDINDYVQRCEEQMLDEFDSIGMTAADASELCEARAEEEGLEEQENFQPTRTDVKYKTHAGKINGISFILSDETPDRLGDIIMSNGWKLTNFKKNPIALFGHRSDFPIGKWHDLRVDNKMLLGELEFAPFGTSERIDEIRKLVEAGILKAVSVGFKPLKHEPLDAEKPYSGSRFLECELVETSLVSVPANPNALAVVKSLGISEETKALVFAGQGNESRMLRRNGNGGQARRQMQLRTNQMTPLGQRIADAQAGLQELRDKLLEHLKNVDDTNVSDAQLETTNELNAQIAQREKQLNALKEAEKNVASSVTSNGGSDLTVLHNQRREQRPFSITPKKVSPIEYIVRAGTVTLFAHRLKKNPEEVRQALAREYTYYDDEPTRFFVDYAIKAASNPAMTTVAGWAQELVQQINADIMETLMPKSVYPRLAGLGLSLSFGRAGRISVPSRSATPTIAGSFVGEGQPIPVRQAGFTSVILTPKKMAVITTWTREIDEHSIPAIEGLLRDAIREDTAVSLDSVLLDTGAATVVRPAGLLNGVAGLTPTAGGGFDALVGDIKQLSGAILTATNGNVRSMAWLMNPQQVLSAGLTPAPSSGLFPFKDEISAGKLMTYPIIDSGTVPLGTVIVVDAADFVSVGGEAPRFEISDQATLHMEDTSPAQIVGGTSPGTPAFPTRSLWQTDSLALRLILPINWTLRRTGIVAFVSGVTW